MASRTDNFNRANNSGPLGTPSDGGSDWVDDTALGGGALFGISSNQCYDAYDAGVTIVTTLEASAADADVQVTLSVFDDQMGMVGRLSDASNFLWIRVYSGAGYDLFKKVAGGNTNLGSYGTTPANGDVLKLTMSGNSISVYVNGVLRIGPVTESFNNTATRHGLLAFNAYHGTARWDDFSITVGTAAVPLEEEGLTCTASYWW